MSLWEHLQDYFDSDKKLQKDADRFKKLYEKNFNNQPMTQIPVDEDKWREILTKYKINETADINGFKKFSMTFGGAVLESSTLEGLKSLVLGASIAPAVSRPAVSNTSPSIPPTYYYPSTGGYNAEEEDKQRRLAEIMKTRTMPPPGGWRVQDFGTQHEGPVTEEPVNPPLYTESEVNQLLMRAEQLESEITDTTPEWLKLANQYTIINNRRKAAGS